MPQLSQRSLIMGGFMAALGLGLLSLPSDVAGQKLQPLPIDEPVPHTDGREVVEKLSYPEDRDTSAKFEAVKDYLKVKNPDWPVVVKLAQGLLNAKSDYFYQYNANSTDPKADKRRVSVKAEITRLIGTFPKDGRDFYELTYGPIAAQDLKDARQNGLDMSKLGEVSQKYFHTKAGAEATLLLATLNLELGLYTEAAYNYGRMFSRPDAESYLDARSLFKAIVAFKRSGDGKFPEFAAGIWDKLEKKVPRDGVRFGNRLYSFDELKAQAELPVEFLFGKVSEAYVAMKGGNATRAAVADAGAPFLDPVFGAPILFHRESPAEKAGADWILQAIDKAYSAAKLDPKKVILPAGFPITAQNMILFRGYNGVYAFFSKDCIDGQGKARRAGELAWFSMSRGGAQTLFSELDDSARVERPQAQHAYSQYVNNKMGSILFENGLLGSISHDGKLAYYIDDIAVPPFPLNIYNDPWGGGMPGFGVDGPRGMKDYSRLVAVNLETGSVEWHLGGIGPQLKTEDEEKLTVAATLLENSFILGAPIALNGKLYVLFERDGRLKLACLDPQKINLVAGAKDRAPLPSPELLWVQNLGRTITPLKQDPYRRIQGAFLASADGVIVCPTNAGALIAVDINARSLLWAHTYSAIDRSEQDPRIPPRGRIPPQPGMYQMAEERWRSAAPIIVNGRVILTAYDSDQIQCLDLRSGKLLWSEPRKVDDLYVGGVSGNKVLVVGRNSVRALQLTSESPDRRGVAAWKDECRIGVPCGQGVMSKDGILFVPVVGDPDNKDSITPAVWGINADTGVVVSKTAFRAKRELGRANVPGSDPRLVLGNILFHDGLMFSQSATELTAFPLIEVKKREMNELLTKNPNDPEGLTSRGELLLDEGKLAEAIADFKKAQANEPNEPTERKLKQKLYVAYTEVLRNKFEDGEKFLDEYKTLCEFSIPEGLTAEEKSRLLDEQNRRKGLFFTLVAKGREAQGKLVEAFENYRAFALLGEQKQLVPVPDDANTLARSDVWARGRIDAMIRNAKDPAIRKPLEDKIQKEWDSVRDANDLPKLRDFVKVFGPFFDSGKQAQFLLAEKLLQTGNDEDVREAQTVLFTLWNGSDDASNKSTAARAVDLLARVMVRRGMMEDSIGLFGVLGSRFGDVVVRDGKTGGEIYGELVTDKRYLPYLEPSRGSSFSKYKVDVSQGGQVLMNSTSINPVGDLLPFFKRYRISLDIDMNQLYNQIYSLRITDRTDGEERARFTNLPGIQTINGFPVLPSSYRAVQSSGHLILLHLGQFVYCYDLSEKNLKEPLWKKNLLGDNAMIMSINVANAQPASENLPDGDIAVGPAAGDTWRFRMGSSMLLQPGYAAILTRDGLQTLDPKTGTKLWTRANIASKAMIFGDAKHIVLVEASTTGSTTRVLRATDGMPLEGVKDFGSLLTGNNRLETYGTQILIRESSGKDGSKLRLYDILEGKDVWAKDFGDNSRIIRSHDRDVVGGLTAEGKMEVLNARTGQVLLASQVEPERADDHLKKDGKFAVVNPVMLCDQERFYIFLNRPMENQVNWFGPTYARTQEANGACYCFDRTTGKRLWYTDEQFRNQQLYLERFEELPVFVAGNHNNNNNIVGPGGGRPVPGGGQINFEIVVLDKKDGKLKHLKGWQQSQGFQGIRVEKNGTIEFSNYAVRVRISPDESPK